MGWKLSVLWEHKHDTSSRMEESEKAFWRQVLCLQKVKDTLKYVQHVPRFENKFENLRDGRNETIDKQDLDHNRPFVL